MSAFWGLSGASWFADGLVVAGGVEGQLAQELAGNGIDDADVQVLDEHEDGGSGMGPADADVVEPAVVAEGDFAVGVDAVRADAVVGAGVAAVVGAVFGQRVVDGCWRGPVGQ